MNIGESSAVTLGSDITNGTTTLASSGLSFAIGANESYSFRYTTSQVAVGTTGFDFKINAPGCTGTYINTSSSSASVGGGLSINTKYGKAGTFVETANVNYSGEVVNGGGATTCDLEFAQNTSNATANRIKGGSTVVFTRIA